MNVIIIVVMQISAFLIEREISAELVGRELAFTLINCEQCVTLVISQTLSQSSTLNHHKSSMRESREKERERRERERGKQDREGNSLFFETRYLQSFSTLSSLSLLSYACKTARSQINAAR